MSASLTLHIKNHRDVPYAYSPDDFFTFRATSASNLQINFSGAYHTRIVPGTFLHSTWPLYLSLPRNQCMTMINERIAYATYKKSSRRTIRVQSRWFFYIPRNLCLQFTDVNFRAVWAHTSRSTQKSSRYIPYVYRTDDVLHSAQPPPPGRAPIYRLKFPGSLHTYRILHIKKFLGHTIRVQSQELFTFCATSASQPATKSMHDYDKWTHRLPRNLKRIHRDVPYAYSPDEVLHSAQPLPPGLVPIYRLKFPGSLHTYLMPQSAVTGPSDLSDGGK